MSETFAQRLRRLRHAEGITLRDLGYRIGASQEAINHWERGYRVPKPWRHAALAAALNVTIEELAPSVVSRPQDAPPARKRAPRPSGVHLRKEPTVSPAHAKSGMADTFPERLHLLRTELDLSIAKFAASLGVARSVVWNWEHRVCKPLPERLSAIAALLGVSTEYLLGGDPPPVVAPAPVVVAPVPPRVIVHYRREVPFSMIDGRIEPVGRPMRAVF